jgi:hypothetical protein
VLASLQYTPSVPLVCSVFLPCLHAPQRAVLVVVGDLVCPPFGRMGLSCDRKSSSTGSRQRSNLSGRTTGSADHEGVGCGVSGTVHVSEPPPECFLNEIADGTSKLLSLRVRKQM